MKILLLLILVVLLLINISNTPAHISKNVWLKNKDKILSKESNYKKQINQEYKKDIVSAQLLLIVLSIIFYSILGTKIGTSLAAVLSIIEIVISARVCIRSIDTTTSDILDVNIYKYHRLDNLLKMTVNYVYYIYAIYMLLK